MTLKNDLVYTQTQQPPEKFCEATLKKQITAESPNATKFTLSQLVTRKQSYL